ncbi:hypothetical protein J4Q44_G00159130 [Coregonus suidteri]|uniref:CUE domain-containing protein n=1 Tax=Coregonus suidteri TaxID=861788 RepID=A0AAN8LQZ0_9TELE
MAQGGPQLDYHILQDLKQRFPEIPEGVVSQCLLQNNNNLDICCHLLAQESNRYLYGEFHNPEEVRLSRNHMLHIQLGATPLGGGQGQRRRALPGAQLQRRSHRAPARRLSGAPLGPRHHSPSPGYNPFFDHGGRTASTPHSASHAGNVPYLLAHSSLHHEPITVTLSQKPAQRPPGLQIPAGHYGNSGGKCPLHPALPLPEPPALPLALIRAACVSALATPYTTPTLPVPHIARPSTNPTKCSPNSRCSTKSSTNPSTSRPMSSCPSALPPWPACPTTTTNNNNSSSSSPSTGRSCPRAP